MQNNDEILTIQLSGQNKNHSVHSLKNVDLQNARIWFQKLMYGIKSW